MSANARARGAARWLPALASVGFFTAAAAVNSAPAPEADKPMRPNEPFVIALAIQSPASVPAPASAAPVAVPPAVNSMPQSASIAPRLSAPPAPRSAPAPARFFTINEVMAKHDTGVRQDPPVQLASADATAMATDANNFAPTSRGKSDEPFGLYNFVAPDGLLWTKWRKVADEIRSEEPTLARCLDDAQQCSDAAARFRAIVAEAREQTGRAQLDLVNQRVNNAIRYKSDSAQWGVVDLWSPPLAADNTGSFNTGFGDCEDFAIAKYVALRAAGVPAQQLRVMLVHDNIARMDHAVLAARDEGHWYILDNRWMALVEDSEVRQFVPLFALGEEGVKLLAAPYAANIQPMSEVVQGVKLKFVPDGESADRAEAPAQRASKVLGLRGSIL